MSNRLKKKIKNSDLNYNKQVKLSQCMIVKNEEENIEKALSWGKNIAFEQIVVDTGSTDRTVEIAKKMGAKVYFFEWINDFAAAKNYALDQANGNWIAFLDADEYFSPADAEKLLNQLNLIELKTKIKKSKTDIVRTPLINIEEDGEIINKIYQDRVFRNEKELRYSGAIHENISYIDDRTTNIFIFDDIHIIHTGYKQSQKIKKGNRNINLLENIIKNNPDDFKNKSYLADSLYMKGEVSKAYFLYLDCLKNINKIKSTTRKYHSFIGIFNIICSNEKNIGYEFSDILSIYKQFETTFPESPDPDYYFAVYHYNQNKYLECISFMNKAISKQDSCQINPLFQYKFKSTIVNQYLGYSFFNLNQFHEALPFLINYLKDNKGDTDSLIKILYIIKNENLPEHELIDFMLKILHGLYKLGELKDTLICIKAAKLLNLNNFSDILKSYLNEKDRKWLES